MLLRSILWTARQKYNDWYNGDGYVEDVLVNTNARLVWIGQKKNERVLLYRYVHGSGYFISAISGAAPFWSNVANEVTIRLVVGVAVGSYRQLTIPFVQTSQIAFPCSSYSHRVFSSNSYTPSVTTTGTLKFIWQVTLPTEPLFFDFSRIPSTHPPLSHSLFLQRYKSAEYS